MVVGTFSSIFLATPLEVTLRNREARIAEHTARVLAARGVAPAMAGSASGGRVVPSSAGTAGEDAAATAAAEAAGTAAHLVPGHHLGSAAQPKRRRTGRR
jgi:preprotein translocase subunit SecF